MRKVFFPNLNGVRLVAAVMVVVHHTEQMKRSFGIGSSYNVKTDLGGVGVTLFFVLSGFLITYLLLSEKGDTGSISLSHFYLRRILRIWPLYYLIIILGFFLIPTFIPFLQVENINSNLPGFSTQLSLAVLFLPNLNLLLFPPITYVSQIWSVGVEEQFYLVWPVLIKWLKKPIWGIFAVLTLVTMVNVLLLLILYANKANQTLSDSILVFFLFAKRFLFLTRIDCMAVGGAAAWVLYENKQKIVKVLYSRTAQILSYSAVLILLYTRFYFEYLYHLMYAVPFAVIIVNLAANNASILRMDFQPFDYLGKISYGIYMYHEIAIAAALKIFLNHFDVARFGPWYTGATIYLMASCFILFLSTISYHLFERFFLARKLRFSNVVSGDVARSAKTGGWMGRAGIEDRAPYREGMGG